MIENSCWNKDEESIIKEKLELKRKNLILFRFLKISGKILELSIGLSFLFLLNYPNKKEYLKNKIGEYSKNVAEILDTKQKVEQKICDGRKYLILKLEEGEDLEECKNPDLDTILVQTGKETKKIIKF